MTSLTDLVERAKSLHADNHGPSQIADELNLSTETVTWLLTQEKGGETPKDVHIDWTSVSCNADLLKDLSLMMLKYYLSGDGGQGGREAGGPDLVVGIALSGVPMATIIAVEHALRIAIYHPAKHSVGDARAGSLSGTFAPVAGRRCVIIDDVITSGKTMKEVVDYLRCHGADPVGICVLFDKRGISDVDGVPVSSLFRISRL